MTTAHITASRTIEIISHYHPRTGLPVVGTRHVVVEVDATNFEEAEEAEDFAHRLLEARCALLELAPEVRAEAIAWMVDYGEVTAEEEPAVTSSAISRALGNLSARAIGAEQL